jgi:hypothetical protein
MKALTKVGGYILECDINPTRGYYESWAKELEEFVKELKKENAPESLIKKYENKINKFINKSKRA